MQTFSTDYIVRICRFAKDNPRRLVGTVEEVGIKGKKAFTTLEELWEIVSRSMERNNKNNERGKGY